MGEILSDDPASLKNLMKKDAEPDMIANTRPDGLAQANQILIRIMIKDKVAVACINEFILRDKFHYKRQQLNTNWRFLVMAYLLKLNMHFNNRPATQLMARYMAAQ